jgi:RNA polymerase sigma factor (sigma-70 family)
MFKELLARVEHCLKRLPAKEKSVFLLIIHKHRSYSEVSADLGISLGRVRSILHEARAHLKDCVEY